MDWETITEEIEQDDEGKWDLRVEGRDLCLDSNSSLTIRRKEAIQNYRLMEFAVTQLCQRLSIPARYFKRVPPTMQSDLANYDFDRLPEAGFFIRGKGDAIRAVLSERYVPYNNREVIGAVVAAVGDDGLMVRSFVLAGQVMFLKLTSKSVTDQSLQLKAGVMIGNSEVGFAPVTVEPFLYRLDEHARSGRAEAMPGLLWNAHRGE